jgi:uncharacterized membrane protein YfcA
LLAAEILGLAPWEAVLAVTIVFVGSATQASIGIGLGLMAAPTLSLIDPDFIPGAIAISVVPLGVGMAAREWDHVDPAIYRAVVGRVAGVLVGAWAVARAGQDLIAIVIGISVLLAVLASAFGVRFAPTPRNLMVAGTAAGFTGTVAGVAGPPMALTYQNSDPRTLRASLAVFNTIGSAFIIPSLWFVGVIGRREFLLGLMLVPGILAGLWVGRHTITRLPAARVRPFVLVVCAGSAIVLLVRQLT